MREEIARRENDMFRGLAQYQGDANAFKGVKQALAPLEQEITARGMTHAQVVQSLAGVHMRLSDRSIPAEQKLAFAVDLLKNYGIDLKAAAAPDTGTPPYVDPEVMALREKMQALESKNTEAEQRRTLADRQQQEREIKAWAEDGKHPYFYDVSDQMALLIRGSGGTMDREEAYQQAIKLNPVTWAKEQDRIATEAATKALQEQKDKAAEAERARRARIRTSGHQGGGAAPSGSMDETMKQTLVAIHKREAK